MSRSKKSREVPDKLIGHLGDVFSTLTKATVDVIEAVEEESTAAIREIEREIQRSSRRASEHAKRASEHAKRAAKRGDEFYRRGYGIRLDHDEEDSYKAREEEPRSSSGSAKRAASRNVSRYPTESEPREGEVATFDEDPLDVFFDLVDNRPFTVEFRPGRSSRDRAAQIDAAFRPSGKVGCVYTVQGSVHGQERGTWAAGEDSDGVFMTVTLGAVHGVISVEPHPRLRTHVLLTVLEGVFDGVGMVGSLDLVALRDVAPE